MNITKILKIAGIAAAILLLLLVVFINRGIAGMLDQFFPGSSLWTHLVLLAIELFCLFWFWRGLFRRGEHLVLPALHDIEGRERFAREFAERMVVNPNIKPLLKKFEELSNVSAADILAGALQCEEPVSKILGVAETDDKKEEDLLPPGIALIQYSGLNINDPEFYEQALEYLDYLADQEIKRTAQRIFAATALSQNGRIDALIVFVCLCRLVWRVSSIYNQRPHPKEIISLYWVVASSTFIALSLEELDLSSEIAISFSESFQAVAPAASSASLPFVGSTLQVFTSSVADGAANCYLALRAGIITRNAYSYTARREERPSRLEVYKEAGSMLLVLSQSLIESLVGVIGSKLSAIPAYAKNKTLQMGRDVATGLAKTGENMMGTVESGADATIKGGRKLVTGMAQGVGDAGKSIAGTVQKAGSGTIKGLGKGVRGSQKVVGKIVKNSGKILRKPFKK